MVSGFRGLGSKDKVQGGGLRDAKLRREESPSRIKTTPVVR